MIKTQREKLEASNRKTMAVAYGTLAVTAAISGHKMIDAIQNAPQPEDPTSYEQIHDQLLGDESSAAVIPAVNPAEAPAIAVGEMQNSDTYTVN